MLTNKIPVEFDNLIENVLSFDKTDICPFEKAVAQISDPNIAYAKLTAACTQQKQSPPTKKEPTTNSLYHTNIKNKTNPTTKEHNQK